MDALAEVSEAGIAKDYHIETESGFGQRMAIRIAEYAVGTAYDSIDVTKSGARMTIPHSAVIFLRAGDEVPDEYVMEINYPGGEVFYGVPVIRIKDYGIDELFEKKLFLLLPYYGFVFEKEFSKMETEGIEELKVVFDKIDNRLSDSVEVGVIDETQRSHLLDWSKRVLEKLTYGYTTVAKGVEDLMGGYILHTRTDDILDLGREQGGMEREREIISDMLHRGKKPEEIADFCGFPIELVEEVEKALLVN